MFRSTYRPFVICLALLAGPVHATILGFSTTLGGVDDCTNAATGVTCSITTMPPNPVTQNPNDGVLLVWDEVQNVVLTQDLAVDRVFDETAPSVRKDGQDLFLKAGTIVSSHYVQWDPSSASQNRVDTSLVFDSEIFAFITADQKLFDSDAALGLPGIDYNDFGLRGLEGQDTTAFRGNQVDISWNATNPGDWTRLITAFSPTAAVPAPAAATLLLVGLAGLLGRRRRC